MTETINRDWTFRYFPQPEPDRGRAAVGYDDHAWRPIALPHTWSTYETTRQVHPFIQAANEHEGDYWWRGWGWYRKRLMIGEECAGRLVSLEFDGVQKYARVYVNGQLAGEHKGGYTSFSIDITRQVKFGQQNLIAVEVSNQRNDPFGGIPPMTAGNFDVYGGMYRDVRLEIQDRLHFPFQGSADYEGGTFVTTPQVSAERGTVRVETWVRNDYAQARPCELVTTILDSGGNKVARIATKREIAAGETFRFDQQTDVTRPHLWSPATPYLYRVHSEIRAADGVADEMASPLGFRWFHWDKAEHKLYLNGRAIVLNGTNRHEEYPWLGAAIPKWMEKKDLEDMRWNLGHNFQRTVHYPNDPYVYELSDQLGIITTEEVPNIKDLTFGRDIQHRNVREMIRRDRNHPCIFFWGMGNETNRPADSAWAKEEDTTRIINLRRGTNGGAYVQTTEDDLALETLLRCTIRGWHDGDRAFPEDGHPPNGQRTGTEEWQHDSARTDIIRRQGHNIVVFLYADHGADRKYRYCPLLYVNPKGWVDAYRNPKYIYYLWQANFGPKPMLFIEPHLWRQQYLGQKKDITVDSNCETVTLRVNGRSVGKMRPSAANGHSVTFQGVDVERGVLSADGERNGAAVHTEVRMPGAPAAVRLAASSTSIPVGRNGIATVSAEVVDAAGVRVIGAHPPLHWNVNGAATLVGPELYESDSDKDWSQLGNPRKTVAASTAPSEEPADSPTVSGRASAPFALTGEMYIDTPIANVIRSAELPGKVVVTVTSPGLQSGRVELEAN